MEEEEIGDGVQVERLNIFLNDISTDVSEGFLSSAVIKVERWSMIVGQSESAQLETILQTVSESQKMNLKFLCLTGELADISPMILQTIAVKLNCFELDDPTWDQMATIMKSLDTAHNKKPKEVKFNINNEPQRDMSDY